MSELTVPYLAEHQAPDNADGGKPGYNPPPEEKKVLQLVDRLYSKAKKYRKRYDQKWIDFYKMFRGRQWKEVRPAYRHSEVLNLVFQTIESMVPTMTDSRPKLEFIPEHPDMFELADILNKVAENDWVHNNWLYVLTEILFDSHFYGTSFGRIGFDPKAAMGLGNIEFESEDPFYCFPDPAARDVNEKRCRYFIHAEPTPIEEVKKQYPDKAQFIMADVLDFAQGDKADIYQVMFKSPVDSKLIVEGPSGYDSIAKNQTLKITCYFKDDSFEEEEQIEMSHDSEGVMGVPAIGTGNTPAPGASGEKTYVQKLKYPTGRKIVVAGGVLLEDGPMNEDGLIPYVKMVNYILPREFWGMGEVEQLEGPQKTMNKLISFSLDVMTLMGNPIWVVDSTKSGIDTDNLFNKPGLVVETDDMEAVRREPGVELQPFIMQMMDKYSKWIDGISGQTDLSRGAEPDDVTAASAIEDLQEAQQTRLRLKSRNVDRFLQQMGELYIHRVFQDYSVPRMMRVTNDAGVEDFFQFHVESLDQYPDGHAKAGQPAVNALGEPSPIKMAHVTRTDPQTKLLQTKSYEITGRFDIRVATGSTLPFAKAEKMNQSITLFKLGVIDDEELLKNIDYPNWEAVLQRVNQKKAASAQAQQQMQMQQLQMEAQAKSAVKGAPAGPHMQPPGAQGQAPLSA